ncbi:MAG: DHH family phosphoesterase [Caldilineaceae bacterium]|nr:DHH family phosphoesterase [Caldilineaceae bacterium]
MAEPWSLLPPAAPSPELIVAVGGHPLIAHLLAQRGITEPAQALAFLDPAHYTPAPPTALFGMDEAARLLHAAIHDRANILVWGDFDVDGQTSTSLLVAALRRLAGDQRVRFHVPNRFTESHGIRLPMLEEKLADPDFPPDLLLTCDTGISDGEAVGVAKDRGLTVIITDHHDLPSELLTLVPGQDPIAGLGAAAAGQNSIRRADAIVNPKLQPEGEPLRTLPGVGVAFKLIQQLYSLAGRAGEENDLLDLVALGIVADVAQQVHDARYLLQLGLQQLRQTRRTGLLALMEVARVNRDTVDAEAIGFQIGPRMNALGRLEDATVSVELLTTRDAIRAGQLAGRMERLNQQRRLLTSQTTAVALEMVDRNPALLDYNGLVLSHPAWHAGIVGIVASRLAEEFHKPTILLLNPPGEAARGSARSIPGVDIGAAIAGCAHLLLTHGGHPGAAGMSLTPDNIDRFRRELDSQIELNRIPVAAPGRLIDAQLPLETIDLAFAEQLQRLAPFGNGNPTPQFLSTQLTVASDRRMGREGQHRRLEVSSSSGARLPVLWFNSSEELPTGPLDLVYTISINTFRGERTLQLNYVDSRASQADVATLPATKPLVKLHDLRNQPISLEQLPAPAQATWYAEGTKLDAIGVAYAPRTAAAALPGRPLVIFSAPPTAHLLRWLHDRHQPSAIYLVGQLTNDDGIDAVIRAVAGMCKYALQRGQPLQLDRMAARLGLTTHIMRHSLLWLQAKSHLSLQGWENDDNVQISATPSATSDPEAALLLQAQLTELLAEVRAYRRYFLRAKLSALGLPAA